MSTSSADSYQFLLSDQYRTLAKKELREDDDIREQSLAHLRDWIAKNPYIKKCRTDTNFLLKFLRFRKFSVHQAGEAIERFLVARHRLSDWLQKMDPCSPEIKDILEDGPITILGRDEAGRTVIVIRPSRFNVEQANSNSIFRYLCMMIELLTEQEEVQIGGIRVWEDFTDMPMKFIGLFSLTEISSIMEVLTKTMPIRIREVHGIKLPKFAVAFCNFALSFASSKIRERILCHATVLEAKKHLQETLWPKEFGGSIDVDELNRRMRKELEEKRDSFMALDEMEIDVEHYSSLWQQNVIDPVREIDSGIVGSFRKLNVD